MADGDWRVTATLHDEAQAGTVLRSLHERELADDVRRRLGRRVAVSADGARVFLYAGSENAAREAEGVARELLTGRGLGADFALDRWHPVAEEWEAADVAMPQTEEQRAAEHQRLEDSETRESVATGAARWEVRVELPSHRDALHLSERLAADGHPVIRRWKFLVVGANDEDDARGLAGTITQLAPAGAAVQAQEVGPLVPFAQFGPIPIW